MAISYRQLRQAFGYNIKEVSEAGKISYLTLYDIDRAKSKPLNVTMGSFLAICKGLGVHPFDALQVLYDVEPPEDKKDD